MAYQQEQINPYTCGDKAQQVEAMFDNIAPTYDTLNHRLSWNIDKGWRRKAIKQLEPFAPKKLLDVATGTGDFAIQACQMLDGVHVTGIDISEGMMDVGRKKVNELGLTERIAFEREDCTRLSYPDATFDAVTAAFGIRNFADLDAGLREIPSRSPCDSCSTSTLIRCCPSTDDLFPKTPAPTLISPRPSKRFHKASAWWTS